MMRKHFMWGLLLTLIVTGCGQPPTGSATVGVVTSTTSSPALAATSTAEIPISPDNGLRHDAEEMAKQLGISVDEAIHRAQMENSIGTLGTTLEQREVATFGGLWIQQAPVYRVVVAFTRNGDTTILPYVEHTPLAGLIEVRRVAATYAELKAAQEQARQLLDGLGLSVASGINVQANRAEVYVTNHVLFDVRLKLANAKLPDHVKAVTTYEPLRDPVPLPITPEPKIAVPQLRMQSGAFMAALMEGKLIVQDGCLRVQQSDNSVSHLVIWQPDYFVNRHGGMIEILNRTGVVVGRVGEAVSMGGGEISMTQELERQLRTPIPKECGGPYWLMGGLDAKK